MAARFKTFKIYTTIHSTSLSQWQGRIRPGKTRDWENKGEARKNERNGKWAYFGSLISDPIAKMMKFEIRKYRIEAY